MLTVLVVAGPGAPSLAPTFGALVPASVAGLVADVMVVSDKPETLRADCEPVGAEAVAGHAVAAALDGARGAWVLVVEAGARPVGEWMPAVAAHVAGADGPAARFQITERGEPWWRRLTGRPRRPLRAGLLLPRPRAVAALRSTTVDGLATGRAAVTLPATLIPAG